MDRTLDSIQPPDDQNSRDNMSYVYGRDPSILAYAGRPIPSMQQNLIDEYEDEESEYCEMSNPDETALQTLKVYLRVKPLPQKLRLSKDEAEAYRIANATTLVTKLPSADVNTSTLKGPKGAEIICRNYTFTRTFGPETTQLELFEQIIQQRMVDFLAGHNSTVMTYGTTNSGKSYTLQGTTTSPGIIPRGLEFVFSHINTRSTPLYKPTHNSNVVCLSPVERAQELESKNKLLTFASMDKHQYTNAYKQMQKLLQEESPIRPSQGCDAHYSVWVSFAEIYNENIYDLLSNDCQKRRPLLKLGTDNRGRGFIKGLKTICVNSGSEAYQVLMAGQYNLKVAATALNARSSRSHCIFTIKLLKYYSENCPQRVEISTLSFCDLAGSERLKKTLNVGERLKEAQNINTSLLVLGRCLKSIYEGQSIKQKHEHVGPFRESKLTRLFQRALSGKEQIALIVNVNPIPNLYIETQNVLNFSAIAKKIVVEPKPVKRRVSNSRFSQMVAQSAKTSIDWDDTELTRITEPEVEEEMETSVFVHQDDYDELANENKILKKEIRALKASMLYRDLQIRQELADTYTGMMKKLETDWKNRIRDVEEQQEDQLEWSVNRVENFYKDKINELTSKKRRRTSDDDSDEDCINFREMEIENSRLTSKMQTLKKMIKDLRESNKNAIGEKNKLAFQLGLANEELKSVRGLLESAQEELCRDGEERSYVEKLRTALDDKQNHVKKLKEFLNEAKEEYILITADASSMEKQLKDQAEHLAESRERVDDLEDLLKQINECLAEKTKTTEILDEQISHQSKLLNDAKTREQNLQEKLKLSETTIINLKEKIFTLEKIISQSQSSNAQSPVDFVMIKEELQSESDNEISMENSQKDKMEKIGVENIVKTGNEIPQIKFTSYDDENRDSEIFVELREINVNDQSKNDSETISELKSKLVDCQTENSSLKTKCEKSRFEILSLREGLEQVKEKLSIVDVQLSNYKIANSEKILNTAETMENCCQTDEIMKNDGDVCESQDDRGRDEKSAQTSFVDSDRDVEKLEADFKNAEESMAKLRIAGENDLLELRTKYNQLEIKCEQKEMMIKELETELENSRSASNLDRQKMEKFVIARETMEKELASIIEEKESIANELSKTNELVKTLEKEISNSRNEHESKIMDLEKKLEETEIMLAQQTNVLKGQIDEMKKSMERCLNEKKISEDRLKENLVLIETFEKRIQLAEKKEQEKDEEIKQLQKEIKNHLASDIHDKKMEKEMKQTLRELRETKENLSCTNEAYEILKSTSSKEIQNLDSQIINLEEEIKSLKIRDVESQQDKEEIRRLKLENGDLIISINEKEREMNSFLKNRDETIAKYETLVKTQQEESEQGKREITRLQELLHRIPTTPRGRAAKAADDSLKAPIPVVELSDSETKRTRRGALAPPSDCPSSDVKKGSRKKRLYQPVDDNCIDLEINESVPPTPSPVPSTRSLRTRKK